jgi:TDG/mug DNA glycosylase family protein
VVAGGARLGDWATVARSGPTEEELRSALDRTIDDVMAPGLWVLFCGINPGLWSAARNQHFARPGNRFWPALHRSGFTPVLLGPDRQQELLGYGLGITNLAARCTARAAELTPAELRQGAGILEEKVRRFGPAWLGVVGITAYRTAFDRPRAVLGPQEERVGEAPVWVLPNPSGLNAHYTVDTLATEFARLRAAAGGTGGTGGTEAGQRATGGSRAAAAGTAAATPPAGANGRLDPRRRTRTLP